MAQTNIQLSLRKPYMSWLHRAGIAGMWMTLKYLEESSSETSQIPEGLNWNLSSQSIELSWNGKDRDILCWLFKQSFQISSEGLLSLTGLQEATLGADTKIAIHQGVTKTFLQHHKFYKASTQKQFALKTGEQTIWCSSANTLRIIGGQFGG